MNFHQSVLIGLVFLCSKLNGQILSDQFWILGYTSYLNPALTSGGQLVDFSKTPPQQTIFDLDVNISANVASICDENGNPLFYTNGCEVWDFNHTQLINGYDLGAPGELFENACHVYKTGYYGGGYRDLILLPNPTKKNDFGLFQHWYDGKTWNPSGLYFTRIDFNEPTRKVVEKNIPLAIDSLSDCMAAVRHGNGRDWWIHSNILGSDSILMALYTPDGVKSVARKGGLRYFAGADDFRKFTHSIFSPDGTHFARIDGEAGLEIANFDRCTGAFFSSKFVKWPNDTLAFDFTNKEYATAIGVCFSPNSRFLYVMTGFRVFQFDICAKDIEKSWVIVAEYDGYRSHGLSTNFFLPQLAPNGKIYITSTNSVSCMHTIHEPNLKGLACDLQQHDFQMLVYNDVGGIGNFPNFRLFDWAGSPCDTLGVNTPDEYSSTNYNKDGLFIAPNPADEQVSITAPVCYGDQLEIFSVDGRLVEQRKLSKIETTFDLNVKDWPAGVYFARVNNGARLISAKKFVVLHK